MRRSPAVTIVTRPAVAGARVPIVVALRRSRTCDAGIRLVRASGGLHDLARRHDERLAGCGPISSSMTSSTYVPRPSKYCERTTSDVPMIEPVLEIARVARAREVVRLAPVNDVDTDERCVGRARLGQHQRVAEGPSDGSPSSQ